MAKIQLQTNTEKGKVVKNIDAMEKNASVVETVTLKQ
jgi:hypothetical protein